MKQLLFLKLLRYRKTKVIWTVHNIEPHEGGTRDSRDYFESILRNVDGVIFMDNTSRERAIKEFNGFKDKPFSIVPHGNYRGLYRNEISKSDARRSLGISVDEKVILLFGKLSPYKGVEDFIRVFKSFSEKRVNLVIAGKPVNEDYLGAIKSLSQIDSRIHCFFGHVSDNDVQLYMKAADLVVLPYLRSFTSGAVLLALSFNRPVLAVNVGFMNEVFQKVGAAWVKIYNPPLGADELGVALKWSMSGVRPKITDLEMYGWGDISKKTLDFYKKILK